MAENATFVRPDAYIAVIRRIKEDFDKQSSHFVRNTYMSGERSRNRGALKKFPPHRSSPNSFHQPRYNGLPQRIDP